MENIPHWWFKNKTLIWQSSFSINDKATLRNFRFIHYFDSVKSEELIEVTNEGMMTFFIMHIIPGTRFTDINSIGFNLDINYLPKRIGIGTKILKYVEERLRKANFSFIFGTLSRLDIQSWHQLTNFYEKNEFKVLKDNEGDPRLILKIFTPLDIKESTALKSVYEQFKITSSQ